ncbi:hypothetical protein [Flavobacterium sp. W22_SRS_FP1]|uniref:hypothetical protein n=1 Tax=Flavobacterium sp. W22_SRS_FP1 TaxID=3240276 RepID=UPI003F92381C
MVDKAFSNQTVSQDRKIALEEIIWLAGSFYDRQFGSDFESRGFEDAFFVRFVAYDKSEKKKSATDTAYNGHIILPKSILTANFCTFRVMPLSGAGPQNKNLALFPRKIKGKYAMLSRIDGVNNYLMFSEKLTQWDNAVILQ